MYGYMENLIMIATAGITAVSSYAAYRKHKKKKAEKLRKRREREYRAEVERAGQRMHIMDICTSFHNEQKKEKRQNIFLKGRGAEEVAKVMGDGACIHMSC